MCSDVQHLKANWSKKKEQSKEHFSRYGYLKIMSLKIINWEYSEDESCYNFTGSGGIKQSCDYFSSEGTAFCCYHIDWYLSCSCAHYTVKPEAGPDGKSSRHYPSCTRITVKSNPTKRETEEYKSHLCDWSSKIKWDWQTKFSQKVEKACSCDLGSCPTERNMNGIRPNQTLHSQRRPAASRYLTLH